jgi:hypothetical protein
MTYSQKLSSFVENHSFVSCIKSKSVEEALQDLDWINAMHEELNNFTRNEVWTLEERPQDAGVIGTKWVFRNKQDDQGIVVRNKVRLVAKGFSQVEDLDLERPLHWWQDSKPFISSLHMDLTMKYNYIKWMLKVYF